MTGAEIMNEAPTRGGVARAVKLKIYKAREFGEFDFVFRKEIIFDIKKEKIIKSKQKIPEAKFIEEVYSTSIPYHFQVFSYSSYYFLFEEYSKRIKKVTKFKVFKFIKKEGIEVGPYNVWAHLAEKIKKICKEGYAGIYYIPKEKINKKNWEQLFWRYATKEFKAYVFASLFK